MLTFFLAVLGLLGAAMWLLSVPFDFRIRVDWEKEKKVSVQITWFYGLLQLQPDDPSKTGPARQRITKIARRRTAPVDARGRRFFLAMTMSPGFLSRALRFVVELLRAIEFRDNTLFLRFGLADPADTGQAMGVLGPALMWIPNARLEPDFYNACFELHADSTVRIVPLRFLKLTLWFAVAPELWRAMRNGIRTAS